MRDIMLGAFIVIAAIPVTAIVVLGASDIIDEISSRFRGD